MDVPLSHAISDSELVEGDHIYAWRAAHAFSHQGIYVGRSSDGVHQVVHFLGGRKNNKGRIRCPLPESCTGHNYARQSGVSITCLTCFLQGSTLRRYKYDASEIEYRVVKRGGTCTTRKAQKPKIVVARASRMLETNGFGHYDLFARNCESFALYCKTGDMDSATSNQVRQGLTVAIATATVLTFGIAYAIKSIYSNATGDVEEEEKEEKRKSRVAAAM